MSEIEAVIAAATSPIVDLSVDEPPAVSWRHADADDHARAARVPMEMGGRGWDRVSFDNEEATLERDGEYHVALVKVRCPGCGRMCAPLLSKRTRFLDAGLRWVGISYREPFERWFCVCPGCRSDFILTTHTPQ